MELTGQGTFAKEQFIVTASAQMLQKLQKLLVPTSLLKWKEYGRYVLRNWHFLSQLFVYVCARALWSFSEEFQRLESAWVRKAGPSTYNARLSRCHWKGHTNIKTQTAHSEDLKDHILQEKVMIPIWAWCHSFQHSETESKKMKCWRHLWYIASSRLAWTT